MNGLEHLTLAELDQAHALATGVGARWFADVFAAEAARRAEWARRCDAAVREEIERPWARYEAARNAPEKRAANAALVAERGAAARERGAA